MFNKKWSIVALVVVVSTVLAACGAPAEPEVVEVVVTEIVEKVVEGETVVEEVEKVVTATPPPPEKEMRPNVLRWAFGYGDIPTLDPSLSTDTSSIQVVDEITIGLTRLDEETLELQPGMAQSWDASEDGMTWTFYLLEGIPWVRWDGQNVVEVPDDEGNVRYVTAHDFEYAIKRTCNPETASNYAYVLGYAVAGCEDLLYAEGYGDLSDEDKQALIDGVQATALDDYTLEVTMTSPAVYNLNIAGMWVAHAEPQWIIEDKGDRWAEPGFNQSYGPYALKEWVHDSYASIIKNPFWPGIDSVPVPQIDEVEMYFLDTSPEFAEYEAGNLERSHVPLADLDRVKADPVLSQELTIAPSGCTYYYGFNTTKAPMDNVHMRRALSHAVDRQGLVDNVLKGGQLPAQWFCNPGSSGCPTPENNPDLGIKTDVDAAKAELQAYMDEMGYASVDEIPEIVLMYNTSEGHQRIAEAISAMWQETLGIQATVTNQEWKVYLNTVKDDPPPVWRMGWCLDYPDANNWTFEVFSKNGHEGLTGGTRWSNEEFQAILEEAALEPDPATRQQMYADAEQILVYEDAAIIPIYFYTSVEVTKPYVNRTYSKHGHESFNKWSLDLEIE